MRNNYPKLLLALLTSFLCLSPLNATEDEFPLKIKKLRSIYDGDTFRIDLEGEIPAVFADNLSVRVRGLDTPEVRGSSDFEKQAAYKVRDFVACILTHADSVELIDEGRDKYFRLLASVIINDDYSLTDLLVNLGYAKTYDGGTKSDWTDEELYHILMSPANCTYYY